MNFSNWVFAILVKVLVKGNMVELAEENYKKELKRATYYVGEIAEKTKR